MQGAAPHRKRVVEEIRQDDQHHSNCTDFGNPMGYAADEFYVQ